jgi:hypothetical protein
MSELFTDDAEEMLNEMSNNFALQFEEEEAIDFRSRLYFRRIVVRDGIIKRNFPDSECSSTGSHIWIPRDFQAFKHHFLSKLKLISSIFFASDSHLTRIDSKAFSFSSLESILISRNVEILGWKCFLSCESLSFILFESNSHLTRIAFEALSYSSLQSILIQGMLKLWDQNVFHIVNHFHQSYLNQIHT